MNCREFEYIANSLNKLTKKIIELSNRRKFLLDNGDINYELPNIDQEMIDIREQLKEIEKILS